MFIEEDFEQHIVNLLNAAKSATPSLDVKFVGAIDGVDLGTTQMSEYFKVQPAVLVGLTDFESNKNIGQRGDSQFIVYDMTVMLFVQSKEKKGGILKTARPILRQLKDILRGLRYTASNGATENAGRLYLVDQRFDAAENGFGLFVQNYELHTNDTNDTRRAL